MHFSRVAQGLAVAPVVAELEAHPELWNQHPMRKVTPGSPHAEMDDIWVRAIEGGTSPEPFRQPHHPVFYPAWGLLPSLRPIVFDLMRLVGATHLGGILITRLPPGARILPHCDAGGWHAEFHDAKVYVALQSNLGCINRWPDGEFVMRDGEAWQFENRVVHEAVNRGARDRLVAIVSMATR